jgi:hypothetical protein
MQNNLFHPEITLKAIYPQAKSNLGGKKKKKVSLLYMYIVENHIRGTLYKE